MTRHLSEDLQQFWPATPKNEMAEANLVLHLGAVLRARRFRVFAEVPLVGERTAHIDLLAFNDELAIAVEANRLFNTDKADEMASDFERVMDGQLPTYEGSQRIPNTARLVGLIVASTWQTSIRDWWLAEDQRIAPGVGAGWGRLSDALDAADGDVGVLQIQDDPDGSRTQWLLYAWKERTMPFTPTPPPPPPMSR
ncbi:MAG TPA: hypothetical protein ENK57_25865 [Polyangiaceae bacterium]|nr:hypothetical protein [Polyangiaceae bacterium]